MAYINLIVTDVGLAEIVNAENNGTAPVTLTEIRLGTGRYTASANQTALRSPFKTMSAVTGGVVGDNILHISTHDSGNEEYTVYEIGIYTESGTLFAVCSQNDPILEKAATSHALIALDIALSNVNPDSVTVGDTNFLLNTATTEQQGIVELATEAEAKAGTDTHRAVTPKALDVTIEGHDNIVHRSGSETITGAKTFARDITVTTPATSAPSGIKINDTNGKGTGYLAQYYAGNEYYTRVMCKNTTSGKSAHIDVKINDDGTSMFSPSVDVMCAPPVPESDKSAKVATTEWVSNKVAKYLPLTGGTISGTIFTSGSGSPVLSVRKGNLNGGRIFLFAPDDADFLGGIVLRAYNSDNSRFADLTIKSDNTMTWNGKNIVRSVNNVNASTAGNVTITAANVGAVPTSGGTMTGNIDFSGSYRGIGGVGDNQAVFLRAGSTEPDGGGIVVYGKNHEEVGAVTIFVTSDTARKYFTARPDGSLTWDGKNIVRSVNNTVADAAGNVSITSVSGNAGTATKLQTARTISLSGDVTGSTSFDGSGNVSITATVKDDSHSHSNYLSLAGGTMTGNISMGGKALLNLRQMEFDSGAYLDFHYTDGVDYTSRIMESASGKIKITANNGVEMTGSVTTSGNFNVTGSYNGLNGVGTKNAVIARADGGAGIVLYGKEYSGDNVDPGQFTIYTTNGTQTQYFSAKPDGSLTWQGKNIVRSVNNVNASAAGNVTITAANVGAVPTSGGAITSTKALTRDVNTSFLGLHGGTGQNNDGAQLFLCGSKHSGMEGAFQLNARTENVLVTLQGSPNGELIWDSKYVLNNSFLMPVNNGAIHLTAGTSATGGAYFRLYGKDNASGAGQFNLAATNGTSTKALSGKPDGSLTWDGKDITLGFPDIANAVTQSFGTQYTAAVSGWISIRLATQNEVENICTLTLNGKTFAIGRSYGYYGHSLENIMFPIKKGDVWKVTHAPGGTLQFMPMR